MALTAYITGNLGQDSELKFLQSGQAVLEVSVACTPRRKDKNTGEWQDDGDPLWVRIPVWGEEAERLVEHLRKGTRISCHGTLVRRVYTKRDGTTGESLELTGVRDLAIIPKGRAGNAPQRSQEAAGGAYGGGQYTGQGQQFPQPQTGAQSADVWGANQGGVPF